MMRPSTTNTPMVFRIRARPPQMWSMRATRSISSSLTMGGSAFCGVSLLVLMALLAGFDLETADGGDDYGGHGYHGAEYRDAFATGHGRLLDFLGHHDLGAGFYAGR